MRRMSKKRRALLPERQIIRGQVFQRDDYRCRLLEIPGHVCNGHLTPHHRLKASQGGAYTLANLVTACSFGNCLLEDDAVFAAKAHLLGLVVLRGDLGYADLLERRPEPWEAA